MSHAFLMEKVRNEDVTVATMLGDGVVSLHDPYRVQKEPKEGPVLVQLTSSCPMPSLSLCFMSSRGLWAQNVLPQPDGTYA